MVVLVMLPLCWCCLYGCLLHDDTHALTSICVRVLTKFTKFSLSGSVSVCFFYISTCRNAHTDKNPNSRTQLSALSSFQSVLCRSLLSLSLGVSVYLLLFSLLLWSALFFVNDESLFFSSLLFLFVSLNPTFDAIEFQCVQFFLVIFVRVYSDLCGFANNFIQFHNRCTAFSFFLW